MLFEMNETLIYIDSRPRAKSTGHAFGFEGNLGMPVIIAGPLITRNSFRGDHIETGPSPNLIINSGHCSARVAGILFRNAI